MFSYGGIRKTLLLYKLPSVIVEIHIPCTWTLVWDDEELLYKAPLLHKQIT